MLQKVKRVMTASNATTTTKEKGQQLLRVAQREREREGGREGERIYFTINR